jgi:hypothetical protein
VPEVWTEAKVYWTVYFDEHGQLIAAAGSQTWKKRIVHLINQCRSRQEPRYQSSAGATKVAGLLIGLEKLNTGVIAPALYNPSAVEIDGFLHAKMNEYLRPGWSIQPLWGASIMRRSINCPEVIVVSRPLLLVPPDTI